MASSGLSSGRPLTQCFADGPATPPEGSAVIPGVSCSSPQMPSAHLGAQVESFLFTQSHFQTLLRDTVTPAAVGAALSEAGLTENYQLLLMKRPRPYTYLVNYTTVSHCKATNSIILVSNKQNHEQIIKYS